jgi:subtilisin family serine protease
MTQHPVNMNKYVRERRKTSRGMLLATASFAITLILSVFVYSDLSIPRATAQSLQPDVANSDNFVDPYGNILQQQAQATFDPTNGGLVTQYPYSQLYPYQDPYQVESVDPLSPTQTLPTEELLVQENSLIDVTLPETNIVSVIDGNNASLQEGGITTSGIAVLTIQGTDDIAVTGLQCSLDNVQQDPLACGINPVVVENLQPGTHLFQISSVDSAGNIDASPAVFSWNVVSGDQVLANQEDPQQFLQPQLPQQLFLQPSQSTNNPQQPSQSNLMPPIVPIQNQSLAPFQNQSSIITSLPNSVKPYDQQFLQKQGVQQPQLTPQSSILYNSNNNKNNNISSSSPFPPPSPSFQPSQLEQQIQLASNNNTNTSQNQSLIHLGAQQDNQSEVANAAGQGKLGPLSTAEEMSLLSSLKAGDKIPNWYIVVLKETSSSQGISTANASGQASSQTPLQAAANAESKGAEVRYVYEKALKGYAIRVPNENVLQAIQSDPNVAYVEQDVKAVANAEELPNGINRADGDLSSAISGDGTGTADVDIAILDSGIDLDHPDLNVFAHGSFFPGETSGDDDNGHGTHVAGTTAAIDSGSGLVGMAPGARLWAFRVLANQPDGTASGPFSGIIAAIDEITQFYSDQIEVVNMSLGARGTSTALDTAIANSVAAGVTYVVSAGNSREDAALYTPASHPDVITVSAINDSDGKCGSAGSPTSWGADDTFADGFSNFGSVVDMAAPGVDIRSTFLNGGYNSLSGTSMASPHVAGAAALYKEANPTASPLTVRNTLQSTGSISSTVCDGNGHGYFSGDVDFSPEPLLYVGVPDTTRPTVISTDPAANAIGVPRDKIVRATFSEPMQASSIGTSTFTVKNPVGNNVAGTVTLSSDGKTASFQKTSTPFAANTKYTVTITTAVKDLAGNTMAAAKIWTFTTGS